MKYCFFYLSVIFLSLNTVTFSQSSFIQLNITGSPRNTVSYSKYLNEDLFMNLKFPETYITKQIGENYLIEINQKSEIFFQLILNNQKGVTLALNKGDTIILNIFRDTLSLPINRRNYNIDISGSNEEAHIIYKTYFNPIAKTYNIIDSLINNKDYNLDELYNKCKLSINQKLLIWDSLLLIKKVSEPVYMLYYKDSKAGLYSYFIKYLLKEKTIANKSDQIQLYDSLITRIFIEQGGSDKYLLRTYIGSQFHESFLRNKIQSDSTIKDSLLKKIYTSFYYLYDSSYREKAWGNSILLPAIQSPFNENIGDKTNAIVFSKYYPNSIYLKKLNAIYDSIRTVRKKNSVYQEINTSPYSSIKEISSLYNERFYFVDAWASWCAPCISEFAHTRDLEIQLDSMKIKKIYLSIDEQKDSTTWKDLIKKYYLNGSHFLVGKDIQIEILKSLVNKSQSGGLSIPQYFVYDKLKNQFYMNLSRPSSGIILYEELRKIVKSKN